MGKMAVPAVKSPLKNTLAWNLKGLWTFSVESDWKAGNIRTNPKVHVIPPKNAYNKTLKNQG